MFGTTVAPIGPAFLSVYLPEMQYATHLAIVPSLMHSR